MWIAALAQQHKLTLVTRDSHFEAVDGLLENSVSVYLNLEFCRPSQE